MRERARDNGWVGWWVGGWVGSCVHLWVCMCAACHLCYLHRHTDKIIGVV